ncbi:MAG: hypothetical protein AAB879_02810 [Patescibacteria group bacterium]
MRLGFSIFELVVVIGLIAAIAGFSVVFTTTAIRGQEFDRVRAIIHSELAAARSDTISGTNDSAWGVAFSPNAATRFQGATFATRNAAMDRTTSFGNAVTISGATEIDFVRPHGIPVTSSTVRISDGFRFSFITVTAAGAIDIR